jgi:chromosome segregation protein
MHIVQIEIDNFKSFFGKTTIPFRSGFTTVSGPNGSGKSNIVDSLLFCLGLSTSRTMRAEKLTDLINNNTRKREASVVVTFSAKDIATFESSATNAPVVDATGLLTPSSPLDSLDPSTLFTIARRVKETASGTQSTYYLQGKPATLSEVHEYLGRFNVSPGCYNVMMQGDVASIVTMSGIDRRKILDELAGIREFDQKIEQAQTEIQTAAGTIERNQIVLAELVDRLVQLDQEKDKALQYQSLKKKKETIEEKLQLSRYWDLMKDQQKTQEKLASQRDNQKQLRLQEKEAKEQTQEAVKALESLNEAVKRKGEDQYLAIQRQLETLANHMARQKDAIDFQKQRIEKADLDNQKADHEIQRQDSLISTLQSEAELLQRQEKELQGLFDVEQKRLDELTQEFERQTSSDAEWVIQRNAYRQELDALTDALALQVRERLELEAKLTRLQEVQQRQSDTETKHQSLQKRYKQLATEYEALEEKKQAADEAVQQAVGQRGSVWAKLSQVRERVQQYQTEFTRLDSRKKALDEVNFGRAVDKVLQAKELSGVIGTVAQLMQVSDEYAQAIEMALGGRLQNIVVEHDGVAQRCIQYLQQQKAGRATFLPLNRIQANARIGQPPVQGGVIDFAINLIDYDPAYDTVMRFALGETLVMETMESARSLLNRYRMVTLDGSLFEKTGAMSGGGTGGARKAGAFFQGPALEKEMMALEDKIDAEQETRHQLEKQLTRLEADLEKAQELAKTLSNQQARYLAELAALEEQLKEFAPLLNANIAEGGESSLQGITQALAQRIQAIAGQETQQGRLKALIAEVEQGAETQTVQALSESLKEVRFQMDYYDTQLRQVRSDLQQKQSEIRIKEELKVQLREQKEERSQQQLEAKSSIARHEDELIAGQSQIEKLEVQLNALDSELSSLKKERDEAQAKLLDCERKKHGLERSLLQAEEQALTLQAAIQDFGNKLLELRATLMEAGIAEDALETLPSEAIAAESELRSQVQKLEKQLQALEPVNMLAIQEHEQLSLRQTDLQDRVGTLEKERDTLLARIEGYEELKGINFSTAFEAVNAQFQEIYGELAEGQGRLVLMNPEAPLSGGLTIEASPRGKKVQRLEAMSGGEKSLTSLAFVFALQRYMPAPFYALDEVDQNLDGINVEKLSRMVQRESRKAQFIVVSLRKPMLENSDRTVGVTQKQNGISKVTGVQFRGVSESVGVG